MASFANFLIIILIISATRKMDAYRCDDILDEEKCDLMSCRRICWSKHEGEGESAVCKWDEISETYSCHCYYECNYPSIHNVF
ncbi:hypothetical protein M5689_017678 [Euphorbia peplus]|nr:hypothetical protein M5689_017678 [Euphorbia peplus]